MYRSVASAYEGPWVQVFSDAQSRDHFFLNPKLTIVETKVVEFKEEL